MSLEARKRLTDLLVMVGPSGVGKSKLITRLMEDYPQHFGYSISHTTRAPRPREKNGASYHFVSDQEFQKLLDKEEFVEYAKVHTSMYGTSFSSITDVVAKQNKVACMDIDIVGAQNFRKMEQAESANRRLVSTIVFVQPPSLAILEQRLRNRGTESEEKLQTRLANAQKEMLWFGENRDFFDSSVVNDNFEECYLDFRRQVGQLTFAPALTDGHSHITTQ